MRYICGDSFRSVAGTVADFVYRGVDGELDLPSNIRGDSKEGEILFFQEGDGNGITFCNTGLAHLVGRSPNQKILITHNSDQEINNAFIEAYPSIGSELFTKWFSQNSNTKKVTPIPIGIENERFDKWKLFDTVREHRPEKTISVYLNIHPGSNPSQRIKCLDAAARYNIQNRFLLDTSTLTAYFETQRKYINELAFSYFVLSPEGAGIDCHRTWEAIYAGAVPVVTRSYLTEYLSQYFPMYLINSWDSFKAEDLSVDLYNSIKQSKDERYLDFDFYWNEISK